MLRLVQDSIRLGFCGFVCCVALPYEAAAKQEPIQLYNQAKLPVPSSPAHQQNEPGPPPVARETRLGDDEYKSALRVPLRRTARLRPGEPPEDGLYLTARQAAVLKAVYASPANVKTTVIAKRIGLTGRDGAAKIAPAIRTLTDLGLIEPIMCNVKATAYARVRDDLPDFTIREGGRGRTPTGGTSLVPRLLTMIGL